MIDLGFVVEGEAQDGIIIERKTGGDYDDEGRWQGEISTDADEHAVVQPAQGRGLQDMPEGERYSAEFFLWTTSELAADDVVIYQGNRHRIIHIWKRPDGGYTKAAIASIGRGT